MSNCIHCNGLHLYKDGAYCSYSGTLTHDDIHYINFRYIIIPNDVLNSDANTPGWCPNGYMVGDE